MKIKAIAAIWICSLSMGLAATVQVPEDYSTIQAAIDAVSDGDRVVVAPGTYTENIDFSGKNFVLTSQDPNDPEIVNTTILKSAPVGRTGGRFVVYTASGPVVQFTRGETSEAVLTGFTIMGGIGKTFEDNADEASYGGGICCVGASPSIVGNVITRNGMRDDQERPVLGGGIFCWDSAALITRNIITENYASMGGGVLLNGGYLTCNVIKNNRAYEGGGIVLYGTGTVIHNTVVANSADWGGNLSIYSSQNDGQPSQVLNNIIAWADAGGGILWYHQGQELSEGLVIQFNAIWQDNKDEAFQKLLWSDQDGTWLTPVEGVREKYENIYAEPGFVDRMTGDYHLRPDSPCINAGDPEYVPLAGLTDMDGEERVYSWRTDIGADEFVGYIRPVAKAGQDQHIPEPNVWVMLDGSESRVHDPCMVPTFSWKQISGPDVELIAADTAQPQLRPIAYGNYEFELVVSDGEQESHPDKVTVDIGFVKTQATRVEWSVSDQGNGHFYQPVRCHKNIIWDEANALSILDGGHLATLTSAAENLFVFDLTDIMDLYWTAISCVGRRGPWLGAYQKPNSAPAEGWTWITGEPFEYTAWYPGQPTGTYQGKNEDRLIFFHKEGVTGPTWNDEWPHLTHVSYVTEFDPVGWQAEWAAFIQGGKIEDAHMGYSGNGYIELGQLSDASIQWDIPMGPWGPRRVSFHYAQNTGQSMEVSLEINGIVIPEPLVLPDTGGWDNWAKVSVSLCFQPGMNHLALSSGNQGSKLNLDQLTFADENTNLALDKSINFPNHFGGQSAVNAVDGDHHSIWNTQGFPQWIEIDLEDEYSIRQIQLVWHDDSIYHYQIDVKGSLESEYTCVVDALQNMEPGTFWTPLINEIDPASARYIRLTVLGKLDGSSNPHAMGLAEFRVNAAIDTPSVCPRSPLTRGL